MSAYVGNDPFEAAANATLTPRVFFGQVRLLAGFCVLQKGIGRVPFDPQLHKLEDRCTEIKIELEALPEMNLKNMPLREMIAEGSEWAGTVLPTIKKLGITNPRDLDGKWVSCKFVTTGRSYTDKNTGEMKQATTFAFTGIFADETACRLAYQAANPARTTQQAPAQAQAPWTPAPAPVSSQAAMPTNGSNPEKDVAWKFAQVFVKQANGDPDALSKLLAANPVVSKYYTINSPEIMNMLMAVPA